MSTQLEVGLAEAVQQQKQRMDAWKAGDKKIPAPFGYPRDFLTNRFVYLTVSPRARGLSIGVNLSPAATCNFDCLYCDVDHSIPRPDAVINCEVAGRELERALALVRSDELKRHAPYASLPPELLQLRHVALSGDGEPTESPQFLATVETVVHVRARGHFPFFKVVLITNASGLDRPDVQAGLSLLTSKDEIWAKLDAGTEEYLQLVNRSTVPLSRILSNILLTAKKHPVIIQSLFSSVDGYPPSVEEISAYAQRLLELKRAGANIPLVQIYSATRPRATERVTHLPLRTMAEIAGTVRRITGLRAEVF